MNADFFLIGLLHELRSLPFGHFSSSEVKEGKIVRVKKRRKRKKKRFWSLPHLLN
jgi:hypothetical protein